MLAAKSSIENINTRYEEDNSDDVILSVCHLDRINIVGVHTEKRINLNEASIGYGDEGDTNQRTTYYDKSTKLDTLQCRSLDPISIPPNYKRKLPQINLHQTFSFPEKLIRGLDSPREIFTQTTKSLTHVREKDERHCKNSSKKIRGASYIKKEPRSASSKVLDNKRSQLNKLKYEPNARLADPYTENDDDKNDITQKSGSDESMYKSNLTLDSVLDKLYNVSWDIKLEGLQDLLYVAPQIEWSNCERELTFVNRKLIELLRSPRSVVCRVACQIIGEMFRIVKSARRPEFDELVDILLAKTADPNRFIQRDANIALDKMITYIPTFHAVRSICLKGPIHKNHCVRTTTARLLNCICAILGAEQILSCNANQQTRKRILTSLCKFLTDKHQDTRKFGEMLCNFLRKHRFFNEYFYKDMELNQKLQLKKLILFISKKPS